MARRMIPLKSEIKCFKKSYKVSLALRAPKAPQAPLMVLARNRASFLRGFLTKPSKALLRAEHSLARSLKS
ncbi:hypothetical protein WS1762 [Wolinella succinogenes]|uniref:Uncharacterized protein n=1 Tax=Wolinella succinogenes (strain ATCC 29543 / DSM 1740 / CCUG 13145 / JCM 31913 / LMG 7466 / NCTC 11488 / FDC 602W) TaxID=273121 RepID=Q7MR33_WOLSU|nr:hypothetical protein WS1762 [Wolinella succinogenes]